MEGGKGGGGVREERKIKRALPKRRNCKITHSTL